MKWIGQHIVDFIARFRSDVYLEDLATTTETSVLVVDSDGKVSKSTSVGGDITGVTAGNALTGGGTSGALTINHEDTSSQASVNNSASTYIQDVTLDTYGHVTGLISAAIPTLNQDTTGTAQRSSTSNVIDESTDTTCFPLFADAATGDLALKSGTNLTFNSNTGVLACTGVAANGFTGDVTGDVTGNADTATLAADATTLATPRAIFGHNFDGSAALTGVIASANLDADTAHLSGAQSFTGLKTFSAGIKPTFVYHSISGNGAGEYGPGAEILFDVSAETTTAGAIYVLKGGVWVLMDADFPNRCRQLAAVAVGTNSAINGMLIKGCVTLAADYTAGTDGEGTRVFASTTAGEATLTAPTASGDTVRVLGYSLNVGDQKMFFNPDNTHIEIA